MPHSDDDTGLHAGHADDATLALLALGEDVPAAEARHVASCAQCSGELARLDAVATGVRAGTGYGEPLPPPVTPPDSVWDAIVAETGIARPAVPGTEVAAHSNGGTHDHARRAAAVPPRRDLPQERSAQPPAGPAAPARTVVPAPRRRTWLLAAAACVAGIVVGAGGWALLGPADTPGATTPVASTRLEGLPLARSAFGRAEVVESPTGRKLEVTVDKLGYPQGFYEVWLIDSDVRRMYPVGVIRDGHGSFTIPDGLNLRDYPIVDISLEPLDGNPRHSGESVLRGELPT